jgi:hypothetical protein
MKIDHCLCTGKTFTQLRELALAEKLDIDGLMDKTKAGLGCGLCRPYLKVCLITGQTVFHEILIEPDPKSKR